jgi:hypothetical protein
MEAKAPMILGPCHFVKGKKTLSKYYPEQFLMGE